MNNRMWFQIEGRPPFQTGQEPTVDANFITPEYFQAMGIRLRSGRPFTAQDGAGAPQVIIINETIARLFFPNENPVGHRLLFGATPRTIVGVVGDTRNFSLDQEVRLEVYLSYLQYPSSVMNLAVRVVSGQNNPASLASMAATIRNQLRAIEPNEPINEVIALNERLSNSVAVTGRRFQTLLLGVFGVVALLIATVGIYGVISYGVSRRTHEIGVRMALGAQSGDVLRMVIWQGLSLTLIGVAIGLTTALALTRVMKNLLFNVSATDPATFALIALLLVGVALIASYVPARRATKVDPLQAIRHE
jgi:predicted permease